MRKYSGVRMVKEKKVRVIFGTVKGGGEKKTDRKG